MFLTFLLLRFDRCRASYFIIFSASATKAGIEKIQNKLVNETARLAYVASLLNTTDMLEMLVPAGQIEQIKTTKSISCKFPMFSKL